jgi:hypothetical protein
LLARHLDARIQAKGTATFISSVQQSSGHRRVTSNTRRVVNDLDITKTPLSHCKRFRSTLEPQSERRVKKDRPSAVNRLRTWLKLLRRSINCLKNIQGELLLKQCDTTRSPQTACPPSVDKESANKSMRAGPLAIAPLTAPGRHPARLQTSLQMPR